MLNPFLPGRRLCGKGLLLATAVLMARLVARGGEAGRGTAEDRWWGDAAEKAVAQAGTNGGELVKALQGAPSAQREGMEFLVENMPQRDLGRLSGRFLLDHVALIYDAFDHAPWREAVPKDIFLNDVLPYAVISETREAWGASLREKAAPLVAGATSPGEAALRLNEKLFPLVHVKYSTARRKAIQSPSETMSTGLATCSGLSILLIDACRSAGVPARFVGIPMWMDNRGNHSWVEVWDQGWHFLGAAEPDPKGLDHGWFEHDASLARKDVPIHAIYASSFKKTGLDYPERNWLVNVVNVTDRYTAHAGAPEPDKARLQVRVLDVSGHRVAANVTVSGPTNDAVCYSGLSKNELSDMNAYLSFNVPRGQVYHVRAEWNGKIAEKAFTVGNDETVAVLALNEMAAPATVQTNSPPAAEVNRDQAPLRIRVLDHLAGRRIAAKVTVTDLTNSAIRFEGTSKGEEAETNDMLSFVVARGQTYDIRCELDGQAAGRQFTIPTANSRGANVPATVIISLADSTIPVHPPGPPYATPAVTKPLKASDAKKLRKALTDYFSASADRQAKWKFASGLEKLLRNDEPAVRLAAWDAYKAAPIHAAAKKDFDTNQVRFQEYLSPYTVKTVGTRPPHGWALFIAMHGGGNAGKRVNDSQWVIMQRYYKDHPEAGGYRYVALRAPNDTWNGFYDVYVYPLIDNLIRQFTLFGDVDQNKVFIMGYSHGGYGAFAIGPKEPDLFAAIHASAGAPSDGETTGKTLRTTVFTVMVGELDTAYGRFDRDQKFRDSIREFRGDRSDIYPVTVQFIPNNPHTGLPDRDKIKEMYPVTRNPVPREISWLMTDKVITDFFWVRTDGPGKKKEIDATCRDNRVTVTTTGMDSTPASVLLDSRLVDFRKPVVLDYNGNTTTQKIQPSLRTLCETLARRGDPDLAFTAELPLPAGAGRE